MNSNTKTILSHDQIEKLIQKHFGTDKSAHTFSELTEGWFNAVYIVSFSEDNAENFQEVVLKTGVQEEKYVLSYEKNIMRAEVQVYNLLKDTAVPVPAILACDYSRSLVDCDYFIMEKLPGDNWGQLDDRISPENEEKLIVELAHHTAALHNVKGHYFGYVRDDKLFQYPDWRSAFRAMVTMQIQDGRRDGVGLPYDAILETFEPLWPLLDEIEEPCLVNFDMWKKNIMLAEKDGEYFIDGIIDHERAFFGDPYADFISSGTICGPVEECELFQKNYSEVSGKPFSYSRNDKIRFHMYYIYLSLLMGVEVYRYNDEDTERILTLCRERIADHLETLKKLH